MSAFTNSKTSGGLTAKLWRGQRMCLIGMNVEDPEPDFVGFSIEVKSPGQMKFQPLRNRLAFSYDKPATEAVSGYRNFPSTDAPFQKFRWTHFPYNPKPGTYTYRITKKHMPADDTLVSGDTVDVEISLESEIYADFLEVGFTRGFASSQAYLDKFGGNTHILPPQGTSGLDFDKSTAPAGVYEWLGFEAYDLLFGILDEVIADKTLLLDVFAYDFDEPEILEKLKAIGGRLRILIDDSGTHKPAQSAPSAAAGILTTAGAAVKRTHFVKLQHNKVLIVKKAGGTPVKVLFGSTNFSFRGIYIQANNTLVLSTPEAASLFSQYFDIAFNSTASFATNPLAGQWHSIAIPDNPPLQLCFSPHTDTELSLRPVAQAIDNAESSVFFAIAFLYQTSGLVRDAVDSLMKRDLFSYGISDRESSLIIDKPDGSQGVVSFAALASNAPPPFKAEWSGGSGINEHNKFVVTDFNLPTAKVFTGSSNLSPAGESGNGDNLICIQDQRVAIVYAIQAVTIFDHLHFRERLKEATALDSTAATDKALTLHKPIAISGEPKAWFDSSYVAKSQAERDRLLFSQ
ncbi:MAG: hypothetical protein JWM43_3358 [Acidobacteriaceae bacterium]|nr:hypothetical protein [Acidobacteriaceae bacterium]